MRRLVISIFLLTASGIPAERKEVAVAAAAGLTEVFQKLGPQFEKDTGIHPVFAFASTAQLAQQIENGAPWDVIAAADTEHVAELDRKHLLADGSRAVYATGILAMWVPAGQISQLEGLANPAIKVIALANPDLAPYGLAARESLQQLHLWDRVRTKVVYAGNANMAKQYGSTGNADAVLSAYSLLLQEKGKVVVVPESLHQPIRQALGIVAASKNQAAAKVFADYLSKGKGRDLMLRSGYR